MLQLTTDLENPEALKKTLEDLIDFVSSPDRLESHLDEYTFIYPSFGAIVSGEFQEFAEETEELQEEEQNEFDEEGMNYCHELPYISSETVFFRKAASHNELHPLILAYVDSLIKQSLEGNRLWSGDETPAGTDAIEALAFSDAKYIKKYIEFLKTNDMEHEVYQDYGIGYIIKTHGLNEDTLRLIAVRLTECLGQHGGENVSMLLEETEFGEYLEEEENAELFLKHLQEAFMTALKNRNYDEEYKELYISIFEEVFEEYPAILDEVEKMNNMEP